VDAKAEVAKLTKQRERLVNEKDGIEKRRADVQKYSKVPASVQEKDAEKVESLAKELATVEATLEMFKTLAL